MRIRRLGVVGAGTMGSGIAALAASAGLPVVVLDVAAATGDRSAPARAGIERARKARPAAFMDPARVAAIVTGNLDDDLGLLADCDLVIEAIVEQVEPKRALYARLDGLLRPDAIVATNTSGIPMRVLVEGRSDSFRSRFVGMHFFNPPRYLHLLEVIPAPETAQAVLETVRQFSDRILGKGVVVANDVPGFIANRLGVYGMVLAIRLMERHGLGIDDVDVLTGVLTGRSKSATFRTADLSGIDVIGHVTRGLSQATGEDYALPDWIEGLIRGGRLGEKTGAGFYRKVGKTIETLDWRTGEYAPQSRPDAAGLAELTALDAPERFAALRDWKGAYGDFVREYLLRFSHYVLVTTPAIAPEPASVDRAMRWGYAWELGPFAQMDLLGAAFLREGFARLSLPEPPLLRKGPPFRVPVAVTGPDAPAALTGRDPRTRLAHTGDATLWDVDGVAVFEVHTKLNTLGRGAIEGLERALDLVAERDMAGLVLGNEDPRAFSAGADLSLVAGLIEAGDWNTLDSAVRAFQGLSMRLRAAPFPVVVAPFGLTLGGGCELSLHAHHVQAHAELYIGLVEVGVGLIPGGGGTKELLFRFASQLAPYPEADPFEAVKRAFQLIAMATTSTSALEARTLGFLRDGDRITMNRDRLIDDAIRRVKDLAPDHVAPMPRTITALGREALGNLEYAAWAMREAGQITEFEVTLAHELAYVLAGGDGPPRTVTEQDILDLERDAFLRLLGTPQTKERIVTMLKTGKAVRN